MFDISLFRKEFPQLNRKVQDKPLIYMDSAATSLKPQIVAQTIHDYYLNDVANIHRGAHTLSRLGTENFENVRSQVQKFIGANSPQEIVFTRGVTESINLLAYAYGFEHIGIGDIILLTPFEHHSNLVPWKILSENTGCQIEVLPFDENGKIEDAQLDKAFSKKIKLVSMTLYSNVTGVRLEVEKVLSRCQNKNIVTVIDAAQAMLHEKINVQKLGCDFLAFSAHKMLGPFGVGVLFGKKEKLSELPPFMGGGSMISMVSWDKTVYQDSPYKFEAGTPSIADVIGFGAALTFIENWNLNSWKDHGKELCQALEEGLQKFSKIRLIGPKTSVCEKADIVSFIYEGAHPADVGEILDRLGIAVRAGHHCAQPFMEHLKIPGTVRVSLAPYNSLQEVEYFLSSLKKVEELL